MILVVSDIINKQKNKPAICVGHGPSLDIYSNRLLDFKKKGFLIYGSNNWFDYYSVLPDYWIVCGALENNLKNQYERLKLNPTITFAYSVPYDGNNYEGYDFNFDCIRYSSDPTHADSIQLELKKYTHSGIRYGVGCNVGLHVITFSILMGCNPIYLIGFDVDHGLGFAKNNAGYSVEYMKKYDPITLRKDYAENYIADLETINNSAHNVGVNIINLNKNAFFHVFKIGSLD